MRIFRFFFGVLVLGCLWMCKTEPRTSFHQYEGKTMGTTYHISMVNGHVPQSAIDSILIELNMSLSTYIDTSLISKFNQSDTGIWIPKNNLGIHFWNNLRLSEEIYQASKGLFDPTVMPLVNLWGFGYQNKNIAELPDSSEVDSILQFVGWNQLEPSADSNQIFLRKKDPRTQLDFSAIAKGYGVDVIGFYLSENGLKNYMVEIGGEVRCVGLSTQNRPWNIGINRPKEKGSKGQFEATVPLKDQAMATSGNYENFSVVEGKKVSHSIHPINGFPERNSLLSATIIANSCAKADALATACMISGLNKSKSLVDSLQDVEAFFIFGLPNGDYGTWKTKAFVENE